MECFSVRLLLDTHAVIWLFTASNELSRDARKAIEVYHPIVSTMSLLEISMLISKKKIEIDAGVDAFLDGVCGFCEVLPMNRGIAVLAMQIGLPHADPFDRVIVATAKYHDIPLLTKDKAITASGVVKTIW